jgi:hypothetical protein
MKTTTAARTPLRERTRKVPEPVRRFLGLAMDDLAARECVTEPADLARLSGLIFEIQTRREFCYLSHTRVQRYRSSAETWIERWVCQGEPVHYYLDIGGGYHASLKPGIEDICFDVGLGELLLLLQIHRFRQRVRRVYAQGVRFSLVVDNLCAHLINDIEVARTSPYCARLRELIDRLGLSGDVDLFVESEHFSVDHFERLRAQTPVTPSAGTVTRKEHETVERFLGRACDITEVAERSARYRDITKISGQLIDAQIDGLHMTQRATPDTICFRSYPGGDSRMQSGQVALKTTVEGDVRPVLLTSHNEREYDWYRADSSDISPARLDSVICAEALAGPPSPTL